MTTSDSGSHQTAEQALANFDKGYNWAQSVLLAVCEALAETEAPVINQTKGINCDCIPRIGTGLAGGVGLQGEVCGALMGGVLIIGLLYGADLPDDEIKYAAYAKTMQFVDRFKAANGTTLCRDLIEIDLTIDKDFQTKLIHTVRSVGYVLKIP